MRPAALLLPLVLAACGGRPGYEGTFAGTFKGERVKLVLKADGKAVSGTIGWSGVEALVSGTVEGDRLTGTVRQPEMGFEAPFEATLDGDLIDWTYTFASGQKLPLTLTREGRGAASPAAAPASIDPQLVGRWYSDLGGTGASGNTVTTRVRCALNADGSFEYGGAESVITVRDSFYGPGSTGGAGPAGAARGQWKCEGQILYSRAEGGAWVALGRYVLSGNDLLVYGADGGKQLWSRE